jgi:hypothetical protein
MSAAVTTQVAEDRTRHEVVVVGRLLVARSTAWLAALIVLAKLGGDLEAAIPGPDILEALGIAVIIGVVAVPVRRPFDVPIARRLREVYGPDAVKNGLPSHIFPVMAAIAALIVWATVWTIGSLFALPILFAIALIALERPIAAAVSRAEALDDPVLERRLTRFARETGLGSVRVRKGRGNSRSPTSTDPEVLVIRDVIDVPSEFIDNEYDVLETRLATAIVKIRHRFHTVKSMLRIFAHFVATTAFVVLLGGSLVRFAGVADITSPGFLPVALAMVTLNELASRTIVAAFSRWRARRDVATVLDLTRAPEAMLALATRNAERPSNATPIQRLTSGYASSRVVAAEVERWCDARRLTLFFSDVANSTELLNQVGDDRWSDVMSDHDHTVRSVIAQFDGEEIDSAGDGFFCVFRDAGQAVLAAIELQRRLGEVEVTPDVARRADGRPRRRSRPARTGGRRT